MPHIEPLDRASITDPELLALMARAEALGVPDDLFTRILARVPSYAKVLLNALLVSHGQGNVDHRLKEIIRIQLARFAGDSYFSALRSKADWERVSAKMILTPGVVITMTICVFPQRKKSHCATQTRCISTRKRSAKRSTTR